MSSLFDLEGKFQFSYTSLHVDWLTSVHYQGVQSLSISISLDEYECNLHTCYSLGRL